MKTVKINNQILEVIDYEPYPHQQDLSDRIKNRVETLTGPQFFVPVWHRRAGKSSSLVNILIQHCCNPKTVGQYYYFYPMKDKVREHLWDNPTILPKYLPMSQVAKKDDQRMVVYFKTGSQLIFDGTDKDPDKHRGGNGRGYVVDEYDDQQKLLFDEIIRPIIEFNKGWVVLCGTPRGIKHLHEAYVAGQDPESKQWWSNLLPADKSVNSEGVRLFTDEQLAQIKHDYERTGIGAAYNQEYLVSFNSDSNQVFRKLDQVILDEFGSRLEPEEPYEGGIYKIGSDPAITHDYWVNSVIDLSTNHEVYIERFQPHDTNLGEARTEALYRKYNNAEINMDESGIGMIIADHLRSNGISVVPVKTAQSKEKIIANLSLKIDALTIRLLPDIVAMSEMKAFSFNRLPSGRYQFSAPVGQHDDCVIARALACLDLDSSPIKRSPANKWWQKDSPDLVNQREYLRKNNTYFGYKKI
jgi:hypothetical protein